MINIPYFYYSKFELFVLFCGKVGPPTLFCGMKPFNIFKIWPASKKVWLPLILTYGYPELHAQKLLSLIEIFEFLEHFPTFSL